MRTRRNVLCLALLVAPFLSVAQEDVHEEVDQMAEFIHGEVAMFENIYANLEWPKEAVANGVRGKVDLIFVVTTTGNVTNVEIEKGLGFGCDQEAKRLIMLTDGYWKPGFKDGKAVNSIVKLPIRFY